jgi:hypothetical protein
MILCGAMTTLTNPDMLSVFDNRGGNLNIYNLLCVVSAGIFNLAATVAPFSPDIFYACWVAEKLGRNAFRAPLLTIR